MKASMKKKIKKNKRKIKGCELLCSQGGPSQWGLVESKEAGTRTHAQTHGPGKTRRWRNDDPKMKRLDDCITESVLAKVTPPLTGAAGSCHQKVLHMHDACVRLLSLQESGASAPPILRQPARQSYCSAAGPLKQAGASYQDAVLRLAGLGVELHSVDELDG